MGWYYSITDEMLEWGLSGSELLVFALVNSYSQRGQGCYWGSLDNTAKVCGISRATAIRTLQSLMEKGFVTKSKAVIDDEFRTIYFATRVSKCDSEFQNDTLRGIKMTPNIIDDNINNTLSIRDRRFVKPTIDEIRQYCDERMLDVDAENFFNFYESKGWLVGKSPMKNWRAAIATWSHRQKTEKKERNVAPKKESVLAHNIKVADRLFGTNNYEQIYGRHDK